jgi:autotransporter translocation and assembly factor TamB
MQVNSGKILRTTLRVLLYALGLFLVILVFVLVFIRTEKGQDIIRKEAVAYLTKKLGTSVSIGRFRTDILTHIKIEDIKIEDQDQNILLNIGVIDVNYHLLALLNNTLSVSQISVDTLDFRMARNENDSSFNFDFISQAFSGPPSTGIEADTSGSPMTFDVGKLMVNQLHYIMDDKKGSQFYDVKSNNIAVTVEKIDMKNQLYKIKSFVTEGVTAKLDVGTSETDTSTDGGGMLPKISIDKISLLNSNFSVQMPGAGYQSETSINNFYAESLDLDLNSNKAELKQVLIDKHQSHILIKSVATRPPAMKTVQANNVESAAFSVAIGSINLKDNDLKYDQETKAGKDSPDFNQEHIHLTQLQLLLEGFAFEGSTIQGNIKQFQAKEQCGLDIQQLTTGFLYTDSGVVLNKFLFKTPSSDIDGDFKISYISLADISKNPGLLGFDIDMKKMLIASNDMKHFLTMAGDDPYIRKLLGNTIYLEGKMKGKVADMTIENLKLETGEVRLAASGRIAGLPDPNKLLASINLKEFSGTTKSLSGLLPEGSIPPNIAANESFNLKGKLGDNKGAYTFDLRLNSSAGNLVLQGNVKQLPGPDKLSYNVHAQSEGLLLDRIMMDTLYGNTIFDIRANGKGISPEMAEAQVVALIPAVYLKGYDYKNIDLNAAISASVINADFQIKDRAVTTNLIASYSLDSLNPLLKAAAHIDNIDLQRLGFMTDTLKFKGDIVADLTTVNAKHINGTVRIPHIEITKGKDIYKLDSISMDAVNVDSTQSITIKSPILDMNLDGYYEMDVLPDVAQNLLIDFITVYPPTGTVFRPAYAKLNGELRYHPFITAFVPGLTFTKNIKFGSVVNTANKDLMFGIALPSAIYNDFIIDSTIVGFHTVNDTLRYIMDSQGLKNASITLDHSVIEGNAMNGIINWDVDLYNKNDSLKYNLAGNIVNDTTKFVLHLNEDQIINSEKWNANPNNQTEYSTEKHIHTNLSLTSGKRQLALQSSSAENGLPLDLKLVDFPITTITKIIAADTAMASGTINGMAKLISFEPLLFTADLKIDSLKAYTVDAGNLTVKAKNEPGVGYKAQVNLLGTENDADLNASYSEKGELNGKLDIRKFNIQTLDPFLNSMIKGLKGNINGNVAFEGTIDKPVLNGELNAKDIQGTYSDYNTFFRIPNEQIQLNKSGIRLNDFVVYDSTGNTAKVNGLIQTTDYRNYNYDLVVKTDHFMALNRKSKPEQEYYGPAYFTSDLRISSNGDVLMVKGNVRVDEKSVINVEMGSVDTVVASNNGIIIYVDSLQTADSAILRALESELLKHKTSAKLGLALNLEMTRTSKLNIFLDKTGGDYMKVAGDANLTIAQQPGGQMDMQGKFTIDNGEYQMTISRVIKRKFSVEKGSSIQWNGSPTDADIDLTALYNVETTAEAILASSQTTNKGAYKQTLPFEVYLYLKKKLMQPAISFKLDMPEKEQNAFSGVVYARIKQINLNESELNKQVMGLLLLNQFVPADPLASGSGSVTLFDYEGIARSTAGAIVSQQLNSMISSKIKSVNIDFDVDSKADYSTGEKSNTTDLNVNLSRTMFNDRYTISVGSTFALEGSEEHKKNAAGLAGNYSAEYKITKDGRYRAKAYRKDQYEADNSGQVIQTGVSLGIFLDFNKYRDIFKKKKDQEIK